MGWFTAMIPSTTGREESEKGQRNRQADREREREKDREKGGGGVRRR